MFSPEQSALRRIEPCPQHVADAPAVGRLLARLVLGWHGQILIEFHHVNLSTNSNFRVIELFFLHKTI